SMATAALPALNDGPVHFDGQAMKKFQRSFSLPALSSRMMEPFLRTDFPETTVSRHFHSSSESVMPRLRVMAPYLLSPGSFLECAGSEPSRYSTGSVLTSRPLTS